MPYRGTDVICVYADSVGLHGLAIGWSIFRPRPTAPGDVLNLISRDFFVEVGECVQHLDHFFLRDSGVD